MTSTKTRSSPGGSFSQPNHHPVVGLIVALKVSGDEAGGDEGGPEVGPRATRKFEEGAKDGEFDPVAGEQQPNSGDDVLGSVERCHCVILRGGCSSVEGGGEEQLEDLLHGWWWERGEYVLRGAGKHLCFYIVLHSANVLYTRIRGRVVGG